MTEAPIRPRITIEDILQFDPDAHIEVIYGEVVPSPMSPSYRHTVIIDNIYDLLSPFVKKQRLGRVHTDGIAYILDRDENGDLLTRIPDLSFVQRERIPPQAAWDRPFEGAPDFAVEVVSPNQTVEDMIDRVQDFLQHGTSEVWVIHAKSETLYQYTHTEPHLVRVYQSADSVVSPLFPDLTFTVASIFAIEDL